MERRAEVGRTLGRWVKDRRMNLNMTQEELAAAMSIDDLDVPTSWVSSLEVGRRTYLPDFTYLAALAAALRTSVTDVLRGAAILPEGVEIGEQAPGSATIHALVDMIDWTRDTNRREAAESLLRTFLEQDQRASRPAGSPTGAGHGSR